MSLIACSTSTPSPQPIDVTVPPNTLPPASPTPATATTDPQPPSPEPPQAITDPFTLISQDQLFAYLEDLTAIQPYSGWRNSATEGEAEAMDYVTEQLNTMAFLQEIGTELERQSFRVFLATELWETRLHLTIDGNEIEVPADGQRGPRDNIEQALRFDSDGVLNDSDRNPVVVEGSVVLVNSAEEAASLTSADVNGKIVFLNYAAINRVVAGSMHTAVSTAWELIEKRPAGLVLVTQFSTAQGDSHGYGIGDVSALNWVEAQPAVPTLYVRLEDLAPAGINAWDNLSHVEDARLTWDADVFSPGTSGNLVAHIPGVDSSRALILGAHIDSPNSPGAMDDGSGSVVLLEIARVLNEAQAQPPVDLVLAWFGSEELGLYGAAHFAASHQELLDRSLAMLEIDCLSRPLDGVSAQLDLVTWSYEALGDGRLTWPDYLVQAAAPHGVAPIPQDAPFPYSDNSALTGFDVPNADLIYEDMWGMEAVGGFHYASLVHSPYDTVEVAREVGDVLEEMTRVVLAAALETGVDAPPLRVSPPPDRRAVFVGSHTEPLHMTPVGLTEFGMALAWEGFDVDLIPYGQAVTPADLSDADLAVVLPVVDYAGDGGAYDEAWAEAEIDALADYVAGGGMLVLTNSAHRIKYSLVDSNEDWEDMNALAGRFGITFEGGTILATDATVDPEHPLTAGLYDLSLLGENGVTFRMDEGQELADAWGDPAAALVDHGVGQVLVLADIGILDDTGGQPNLPFWLNLAAYVRSR
jgi:hypothetical protein